jgi:glycosyltransferase involved in cell wall biosynthesis
MAIIAHITTVHPRHDTRIYFREIKSLVDALSKEVDYFVYDGLGSGADSLISIKDIGVPSKSRFLRFLKGSCYLFKMLRHSDHKVLHFHDPELIPVMYLLSFFQKKIIFDVHECVSEDIKTKPWIPKYLRMVLSFSYKLIEKFTLKRFLIILAEDNYKSVYGNHIVVRNFPDLVMLNKICLERSLHNQTADSTLRICYIGAISESRGILKYAKAVNDLIVKGLKMELTIIGNVPSRIENHQEISLGVRNGNIKLLGRIPADKALKIVSENDLGLAILDDEKNFINSFPTKIFEYMALRMPVITSNFPLYNSVIIESECGTTINPDSVESLKNSIEMYYFDRSMISAQGKNGYECVNSKYSWNAEFSKLLSLYKSII